MPRNLSDREVARFRERLCRAAARRFARDGLRGVTMRQLAQDLGCSPMTPYRYFQNREEILAAVRTAAFRRLGGILERAFQSESDPICRSRAIGKTYLAFARSEPDAYRLMYDLAQPDETNYPELTRERARVRDAIVRHNAALIEAGVIGGDPVELTNVMWAATHGLIVLHLAGKLPRDASMEQLHERAMRLIVRGARPRTRRDEAPRRRAGNGRARNRANNREDSHAA